MCLTAEQTHGLLGSPWTQAGRETPPGITPDARNRPPNGQQCFKNHGVRAPLVAQWLRSHLAVQGTPVPSLIGEDSTGRGATKPTCDSYPHELQLLSPAVRSARADVRGKPGAATSEELPLAETPGTATSVLLPLAETPGKPAVTIPARPKKETHK